MGVGHQYCGELGKLANCQVGVYAALACRGFYSLVNAVLYLPSSWCHKEADIPVERRTHKTKIELAYEMILHARDVLKAPFRWVNFDSFYGRDHQLLCRLHLADIIFMADVPQDATVYEKQPSLYIPQNKTGRGRKPKSYQIRGKGVEVKNLCKKLRNKDFMRLTARTTKTGEKVKALFYFTTVFVAVKEMAQVMEVKLVIRKDEDGKVHYALSNDVGSGKHRLAFMHSQRYFIERSFQECKQQIGLNQYQVRGYDAWHKHMFMCMMGLLFLQMEKMEYFKIKSTPSTPQLAELIRIILPQKIRLLQDVLNDFEELKIPKHKYCASINKSVT